MDTRGGAIRLTDKIEVEDTRRAIKHFLKNSISGEPILLRANTEDNMIALGLYAHLRHNSHEIPLTLSNPEAEIAVASLIREASTSRRQTYNPAQLTMKKRAGQLALRIGDAIRSLGDESGLTPSH